MTDDTDDYYGHVVSEDTDGPTLDRLDTFLLGMVAGMVLLLVYAWVFPPSPAPWDVVPL